MPRTQLPLSNQLDVHLGTADEAILGRVLGQVEIDQAVSVPEVHTDIGRDAVRGPDGGKNVLEIARYGNRDREGVLGEHSVHMEHDGALLLYADGERKYIIAAKGLEAGVELMSGLSAPIRPGNCMPIKSIPVGSVIHCVELKPGKGAQIARSAGTSVQLVAREGRFAIIRLRSGETRRIPVECRATLGEVGNSEHALRSLGKAGATRWRGVRPTVRGVAMNPVDHPHGGGEGRTSGGRHPVSPWGQPTKGHKTRKNKRTSNMIIRRRKRS